MCICDMKFGDKAKVINILGDEKLRKRLLALGFTNGCDIQFKNTAPLGDPIIINLRGFDLALRKNDAKNIYIKY